MLAGAWGATDACAEVATMRWGSWHQRAGGDGGDEGDSGTGDGGALHGPPSAYLAAGEDEVLVDWLQISGPIQVREATRQQG